MKIIDNFDTGLSLGADHPVLIDSSTGDYTTYGETAAFTHRFAHACRERGYTADTKVAVLSHNGVLMYEVVLGLLRSDAVWLPLNFRSSPDEIADTLNRCDCTLLFFEPEAETTARLVRDHSDGPLEIVPLIREDVDAWIGEQPGTGFASHQDGDSIYAIQTTGGTTGRPKAVLFSNNNAEYIVRNFESLCSFTPTAESPRPVMLASAPLTHAAGQLMQVTLVQGGAAVVVPNGRPAELLALIERFRVTHTFLPPTVIYGMLDQPTLGDHEYSSLQYLVYGAAPMSPDKLGRAVEAFGPVLAQIYGQTETGVPNVYMKPADHFIDGDPSKGLAGHDRLAAAGRIAPDTDLVILDDEGREVKPGEVGEIGISCLGVTPGYYQDEDRTFTTKSGKYHLTGDIAYIDADGFVHIVDRKRDMIISGGFNVYSPEVERCLLAFPGVAECAVFGIPDEKWGELVMAVFEVVPGENVDIEELRAFCRHRIGPIKTPKRFEIRDQLPRSAVSKVLKRELRAEHWQGKGRMVS